jgi:lipopolysaccharide export LptBFGC system permease protein LptF
MDRNDFALNRRMYANQGIWDATSREWVLTNGWIRTMNDGKLAQQQFDTYRLKTGDGPLQFKQETLESTKMSTVELLDHIRELGRNGVDVLDLRIALYGKFAAPFTCLVMALVSLPFAFTAGRHGALYGVGISIFIGIVYWGILGLFTSLGHYELLPPLLAAWGPNLLFGAGGTYLLFAAKT